jgi:hypothetical protein
MACHHGMGRLCVENGEDSLQIWEVAVNLLNSSPPAWRLDEELTTPHHKKPPCYEMLHRFSELAGSCEHGNELLGSIKGGKFPD